MFIQVLFYLFLISRSWCYPKNAVVLDLIFHEVVYWYQSLFFKKIIPLLSMVLLCAKQFLTISLDFRASLLLERFHFEAILNRFRDVELQICTIHSILSCYKNIVSMPLKV